MIVDNVPWTRSQLIEPTVTSNINFYKTSLSFSIALLRVKIYFKSLCQISVIHPGELMTFIRTNVGFFF